MFTYVSSAYPTQVFIEQPTSFGTRRLVAYKLDEVREDDAGRECDGCLTRTFEWHIYRDPFGLKIWHPKCFTEELSSKRAQMTWRVTRLDWAESQ